MMFDKVQLNYFYIAVIVLICFLLFSKAILSDYVWDDYEHLERNPLTKDFSIENLKQLILQPAQNYMLVPQIFWGYLCNLSENIEEHSKILHLANILLHMINSILVFLIISKMIENNSYAFLGTLFFLIHPVQVESVAWISEFRGLLSAFWGFLLMLLFLTKKDNILCKNIIGSLLILLSIFSKPVGIVFIPIILLIHIFLNRDNALKILSFILYSILFSFCLFELMATNKDIVNATIFNPVWFRPFVFSDSILFYLSKIVIPVNLYPSYGRTPELLIHDLFPYLSLIIIFILFTILFKLKKDKLVIFSTSFFIIGLLPTSGLVSFIFQNWSTVADRYLYIPMLAIAIMISHFLAKKKKISLNVCFSFALIIFMCLTYYIQLPVWRESKTLWEYCILHNPNEKRAYFNLGADVFKQGKYSEALSYFDKALKKDDFFDIALIARAKTYSMLGNTNCAIEDLSKVSGKKLDEANLQISYLIKSKNGLSQTINFTQNYFNTTNNKSFFYLPLAHLYLENKQYWKSIKYYLMDLTVNTDNIENFNSISEIYSILQQEDLANLYHSYYLKKGFINNEIRNKS